jgi:hypothetical protein
MPVPARFVSATSKPAYPLNVRTLPSGRPSAASPIEMSLMTIVLRSVTSMTSTTKPRFEPFLSEN